MTRTSPRLPTPLDLIGNTPLVHLRAFDTETGCRILGKCEFMNPGGSVKDRPALFMIEAAERDGRLRAGGVVVEGTAGNTGIGLAMVCAAKGYRCILVIPETMSREKVELVLAYGAEVVQAKKAPWGSPEHHHSVARRIAEETAGAVMMDQFSNPENTRSHYETTGKEIWEQTGGRVDALVAGMGTSGTLLGAGRYLKERKPAVRVVAVDPVGSVYHDYIKHGEAKAEGSTVLEGAGIGRLPGLFDPALLDDIVRVEDAEALAVMRRIIAAEGLFVGGTSGLSVAGALRVARELGPGRTLVTVLCDSGRNYMTKLFGRGEESAGK